MPEILEEVTQEEILQRLSNASSRQRRSTLEIIRAEQARRQSKKSSEMRSSRLSARSFSSVSAHERSDLMAYWQDTFSPAQEETVPNQPLKRSRQANSMGPGSRKSMTPCLLPASSNQFLVVDFRLIQDK